MTPVEVNVERAALRTEWLKLLDARSDLGARSTLINWPGSRDAGLVDRLHAHSQRLSEYHARLNVLHEVELDFARGIPAGWRGNLSCGARRNFADWSPGARRTGPGIPVGQSSRQRPLAASARISPAGRSRPGGRPPAPRRRDGTG